MRALLLCFIFFSSVACTRCTSKVELTPGPDEYFATKNTDSFTALKMNPAKFPGCVGYQVLFNKVDYGLFVADEIIYLDPSPLNTEVELAISCVDATNTYLPVRIFKMTRYMQ